MVLGHDPFLRPAGNRFGRFLFGGRDQQQRGLVTLGSAGASKAMPEDDWEDYADNEEDDTTLMHDDGEDE